MWESPATVDLQQAPVAVVEISQAIGTGQPLPNIFNNADGILGLAYTCDC